MTQMTSELDRLRARVKALEGLCADMYQVAGTAGAPTRVLDALSAAASGKPIPRKSLLPIATTDFDERRSTGTREQVDEALRFLADAHQHIMRTMRESGCHGNRRVHAEHRLLLVANALGGTLDREREHA